MPRYPFIFDAACLRKGGEKQVESLFNTPKTQRQLKQLADATYLAEFSKKVFQSGFVWRVVEAKWDNFEDIFWGFDIDKLIMMPNEMLEQKAKDPRIIRNYKKVCTIRDNALMIDSTRRHHNISFAEFIAQWPGENIVGLWQYLKKNGSRLGGNTGPYALRTLGKDTFLLTRDVECFLREHKIIDTGINTKSALQKTQEFFNNLQQESGRSLNELSQLVSFCHGENRVGVQSE